MPAGIVGVVLALLVVGRAGPQSSMLRPPANRSAAAARAGFGGVERGTYRLYQDGQPMGEEQFVASPDDSGRAIVASVELAGVNHPIHVLATLCLAEDGSPRRLELNGSSAGREILGATVHVRGRRATVIVDGASRDIAVPARHFTISKAAPIIVRQELLRYWLKNGRPDRLATLPSGTVAIREQGSDTLVMGGRTIVLSRLGVSGLVPGAERFWLDESLRVRVAQIDDPELGRFVAVREDGASDVGGAAISSVISLAWP
jgi:hypothetical protein